MSYLKESEMYEPVRKWLTAFLAERYRNSEITVYDSSRTSLSRLIQEKGLERNLPPHWQSWDIQIDITGFVRSSKFTRLAFVECKNVRLNLAHVSQLLGYSRVALPDHSFLISSVGYTDSLMALMKTYARKDVLVYLAQAGRVSKSMQLAVWNKAVGSIDYGSVLPCGRV